MPIQIFISHSAEDLTLVRELSQALHLDGYVPWIYEDHQCPGVPYPTLYTKAMEQSKIVIGVISRASMVNGSQVHTELSMALDSRKPIVPLLNQVSIEEVKANRDWRPIVGTRTALPISVGAVAEAMPQIRSGLVALLESDAPPEAVARPGYHQDPASLPWTVGIEPSRPDRQPPVAVLGPSSPKPKRSLSDGGPGPGSTDVFRILKIGALIVVALLAVTGLIVALGWAWTKDQGKNPPGQSQSLVQPDALYEQALEAYRTNRKESGAMLLQQAADLGHTEAMTELGIAYYYGQGVPEDEVKAEQWFAKAARAGNRRAMHNLEALHATWEKRTKPAAESDRRTAGDPPLESSGGRTADEAKDSASTLCVKGIKAMQNQEFETGMQMLRQSAEKGNTTAMTEIGNAYLMGYGVPEDENEAETWYKKASELGDERAKNNLEVLRRQRAKSAEQSD